MLPQARHSRLFKARRSWGYRRRRPRLQSQVHGLPLVHAAVHGSPKEARQPFRCQVCRLVGFPRGRRRELRELPLKSRRRPRGKPTRRPRLPQVKPPSAAPSSPPSAGKANPPCVGNRRCRPWLPQVRRPWGKPTRRPQLPLVRRPWGKPTRRPRLPKPAGPRR